MTRLPQRPKLATKAELRFDRQSNRHVLLSPEKGLVLSPTAANIAQLCDGQHALHEIVDALCAEYAGAPRKRIETDVRALLGELERRGLLDEGP